MKPRPSDDGIAVDIFGQPEGLNCWRLRNNGDFFSLRSLRQDDSNPNTIGVEDRIAEVTEVFLYCRRLYENLGVPSRSEIRISIEHTGLRGRVLRESGHAASVDRSVTSLRTTLEGIGRNLVDLVKSVTAPVFELFDFASFDDSVYSEIVGRERHR
jgi:hypothetical protein